MKATIVKRHNKPVIQLVPESDAEKIFMDDMFTENISEKGRNKKIRIIEVNKNETKQVTSVILGEKHNLTKDLMFLAGFKDAGSDFGSDLWEDVVHPDGVNCFDMDNQTIIAIGKGTYTLFKSLSGAKTVRGVGLLYHDWHIRYSNKSGYYVSLENPEHRQQVTKLGTASTLEELQSLINKRL